MINTAALSRIFQFHIKKLKFHQHHFVYSQTLLCDINAMTRESAHWTQETKLLLESQLLLATEGPLCLDPSIEVAQVANQLQFNKNKFNTHGIRRYSII